MKKPEVLRVYEALKEQGKTAIGAAANGDLIGELFARSQDLLAPLDHVPLVSRVDGKTYFAFRHAKKMSRAVNAGLFLVGDSGWERLQAAMSRGNLSGLSPHEITRTLYTMAISVCAAVDILKDGDQKTPGTFFEYFIGYFFTWRVGVEPESSIQIMNVDDKDTRLPTDFVYNLGPGKQKFHMPIKTSTRERSIMLWAHQRLLDGVYGIERFMGTPVLLAETKTDKKTREVVEICLADQWQVYQSYIAKLKRVYYLDLPAAYDRLNRDFPPLRVKEFGEFFFEWADLAPA